MSNFWRWAVVMAEKGLLARSVGMEDGTLVMMRGNGFIFFFEHSGEMQRGKGH